MEVTFPSAVSRPPLPFRSARCASVVWLLPILGLLPGSRAQVAWTPDHAGDDSLSAGYRISTPGYTLHVQADGGLYDWRSGDTVLIGRQPAGYNTPTGQRDLRRIDDSTLLATDGDRTILYRFFPDRIAVRLRVAPEGQEFFTEAPFHIPLPRTAQAVADAYFGAWDALPTHQYWPNLDVLYSTGDQLRVFIGNRLPAPDLENFELAGRTWTLRIPADAQWHSVDLVIKKSAEKRRIVASPEFTIECPQPHRIFFTGEPARFRLTFPGQSITEDFPQANVDWRVTDYRGNVVLRGSLPVSLRSQRDRALPMEVPTDPPGWMRFEVRLTATIPGAEVLPRTRDINYAVCPRTPELARLDEERTLAESNGEPYAWDWERTYFAFGTRIRRTPFLTSMGGNEPSEGEFFWETSDDTVRRESLSGQQYGMTHFTQIEGAASWAMDPADDPDKRLPRREKLASYRDYCAAIARRYAREMTLWEVFNEPDVYRITPEEYFHQLLVPSFEGIRQGNPQAQVIGGTVCGLQLGYYDRLLQLGAAKYMDVLGIHPYCPGDWDEEGIGHFIEKLQRLMAIHGERKPIWITEVGYCFSDGHEPYWGKDRLPYGQQPTDGPLRNPRSELIVKSYLVAETRGIPRDHYYYYYFPVHGFHPMYVMRRDGSLMPEAVAVLTLHDQLRNARFVRTLTVPHRGTTVAEFDADDRKVLAAWTSGFPWEMPFLTDAQDVRVVDLMGVSHNVKPAEGRFTAPLNGAASYFTLPKSANVEVDPSLRCSDNLARAAQATASSNPDAAPAINDGLLNDWERPLDDLREPAEGEKAQSSQPRQRPPCIWQDQTPGEFPDWVELAFPSLTRFNTVIVYSRTYQTLRDYDLECLGAGGEEWKVIDRVRENVVPWCHVHRVPDVEALRLRVKVLHANSGLMETHPVLCGNRQTTWIREIEVYRVERGTGPATSLPVSQHSGRTAVLAALLAFAGLVTALLVWRARAGRAG